MEMPLDAQDQRTNADVDKGIDNSDLNVLANKTPSLKSNNNLIHENDIGSVINSKISDVAKYNLLKNHWKPPCNYQFPYSVHKVNGKETKRYLGLQHFENHNWLVLSHIQQGLYCKYCVLFAGDKVGHNKGVTTQKFVSKPVTTFSKLFGKDGFLITHESTQYHKECVQASQDFIRTFEAPEGEVINQINKQRLQEVEENRARLRPIVETILFLGRQNIPLRGHRDDGVLDDDARPSNDGNFRELLKFKVASGDNNLKMHLATASARATYIGKNTQNEIINCCAEEITNTIIKRIRQARYYSIVFDETTDISHVEQLSFSVRYVHEGTIHEDFLKFVDAYADPSTIIGPDGDPLSERKLSGKALGTIVLNIMKEMNLDLNLCIGIGTDNCSVMASEVLGAVKVISDQATNACRVPCYNHGLNNSLSKSSAVVNVRNAVAIMKSIISFFNMSAKRNIVIKNILELQLSGLCETRWVERHDGVLQFKMYFREILEALTRISTWKDTQTSSTAISLLHALCSSEFIISTFSLVDILQVTLPVSRLLQLPVLDLNRASSAINNTLSTLENKRSDCDEVFAQVFAEARVVAESADIEIKLPRIIGRQTNRENYASSTPEEYFRRSIYIPLLENISEDIRGRFGHSTLQCFGLRNLLPKVLLLECGESFETKQKQLEKALEQFSSVFIKDIKLLLLQFRGELQLWANKWRNENSKDIPESAIDLINCCDEDFYPTIKELLKILATLPVSVASAERSFSTLRRMKTWLRSRMSESRLTGLCLLHVHKNIELDIDKIIDRFSKTKTRRLDFAV